jgi:hypothetical protein
LNKLSNYNPNLSNKNYAALSLRILTNAAIGFQLTLNKWVEWTINPIESYTPNRLFDLNKYKSVLIFTNWVRGIIMGLFSILSVAIKIITGIIASFVGATILLIASLISLSLQPFAKGLVNFLLTLAGSTISVLSTLLILIARALGILSEGRPLSEDEKNILLVVFHKSLKPNKITIAYFPFWKKYFFALHNTIYTPHKDLSIPPNLLVHESVHVWQYHHEGNKYLAEALLAQVQYGVKNIPGNAYDWTAELSRGKTVWGNFNKEAAAQLIEEIWKEGAVCILSNGAEPLEVEYGGGVFFSISAEDYNRKPRFISKRNHQDFTDLAIESMLMLRSKE